MKKLSSLGICSIPVTLRCGETRIFTYMFSLMHTQTHCPLSAIISVLAFTGRPTSVEWVSWGSADRVWEVRDGQEGRPLWCEFNVFSAVSGSWWSGLNFMLLASVNSWYVVVFVLQRHPDGVASVAFKEPEQADACIESFNGRWFGGRQLSVQLWDGTTDYQVNQRKIHIAIHFL